MYCDHCGKEIADMDTVTDEPHYINRLPVNVNSAKYGESAVLCDKCFYFVGKATETLSDMQTEVA